MRRYLLTLLAALIFQTLASADDELDERLKAVMLLFDKKHQELTVQIGQLELEKQKLAMEVEKLQSRNQALIAENQSLRKQLGLTPEKQVETAASPKVFESYQTLSAKNPADESVSTESKTNVNVANVAELELLPGVGPVIAQRIIDNRPYATIEDLLKVRGIGKTSIEILRPLVRVE